MVQTAPFSFKILHQSTKSRARVGQIVTPHGIIDTPNFISVGTNGAIKGLDSLELEQLKLPIMFANTYHLMIQPGLEVLKNAGGLRKLANFSPTTPLITDSGGFQVFSLKYGGYTSELKSKGAKTQKNSVLKIDEEGVLFRSYKDGSPLKLTPETSIGAQKIIGADIIVAFDELLPYHTDRRYQLASLNRTHRWEERSLIAHKSDPQHQALYAVVHGGIDQEMRQTSIDFLSKLDFDGFAIGGSVGKNLTEMRAMLEFAMPRLPQNKPNHLLGIGDLPSLAHCMDLGIDTFDSSYPTKAARHGLLFSRQANLRLLKSGNQNNFAAIDPECTCYTCLNFTVAYLHHLFKAHELTYYRLATIHNIHFMIDQMARYRQLILENQI